MGFFSDLIDQGDDFAKRGGFANPIRARKELDDEREEKAKKKADEAEAAVEARNERKAREAEARVEARKERQRRNRAQSRAATILTGARGLQSDTGSARKTLMGV